MALALYFYSESSIFNRFTSWSNLQFIKNWSGFYIVMMS